MPPVKEFEIRQVANGFMVCPLSPPSSGAYRQNNQFHVFQTWADASKWLGDQFRGLTE